MTDQAKPYGLATGSALPSGALATLAASRPSVAVIRPNASSTRKERTPTDRLRLSFPLGTLAGVRGKSLVAILSVTLGIGCGGVSSDQIAHWKETERGPKKLRETVKSESVAANFRGEAVSALVEIGMAQEAVEDLKTLPEPERRQVIHEATPHLVQLAQAGTGPTTKLQRDGKDALYQVRADAAPEDRNLIDDSLIEWVTGDLTARMSQGGQGSEKILMAIGARAVPKLIQVAVPGPNLLTAASLLGRIADVNGKNQAADALIARAKTKGAPDDSTLQSIGLIGGPHATDYLLTIAEHGSTKVREHALLSLSQGHFAADPAEQEKALSIGLRIANDSGAAGEVREAAFSLLEKLGLSAVPGLVKIMSDKNETVGWRAVEAALGAGKEKAVVPVLESLSPTKHYKQDDLDSFVIHDLVQIGSSVAGPLKGETGSKNPNARLVAAAALKQIK